MKTETKGEKMNIIRIRKSNPIFIIRRLYAQRYRNGGYFGALWSSWLKTGMPREERARHLLVFLEVKAENATENGKRILRERYRKVLKIEKAAMLN